MNNIVKCNRCSKNFDFSLGPKANEKQICDKCKSEINEEEVEKLKEEMILENNRYLSPKRKSKFDMVDILNGNFPVLENDIDKYLIAIEFAAFINKCGFGGQEENMIKFMEYIGPTHIVVFARFLSWKCLNTWAKYYSGV